MARGGDAALVGTGSPAAQPILQHVRADGSGVLVFADPEPVLDQIRAAEPAGFAAMLELTDNAPVDLREPVRGLLWITGWVSLPDPTSARRLAVQLADVHPHTALLDVGSGVAIARLVPGSVVLSDAEGSAALTPVELAAARPDPFARVERSWLTHLEQAHQDVIQALARHLPNTLRDAPGARIRPLGVDRCGLRLRVETADRDHDVRLAWQHDVHTHSELRSQLSMLASSPCPRATVRSAAPPRDAL